MPTKKARIAPRQDTSANFASNNPVLGAGELAIETDLGRMKLGNGSTAWNSLSYLPFTNTLVRTTEVRTSNGTELVLNAGESHNVATGQAGERIYLNAEAGIEINSSPDNWGSGWAGRNTLVLCNSAGESSFPGNVSINGDLSATAFANMNGVSLAASTTLITSTAWTSGGFNVSIPAGSAQWLVHARIRFTCSNGIRVRFTGPAGSAARVWNNGGGMGVNMTPQAEQDGYQTAGFTLSTGANTSNWVCFEFVLYQGATAGNLNMEFRANSPGSPGVQLLTGAMLAAQKLVTT